MVGPHHVLEHYDSDNPAEEAKVRTTCEAMGYTWKYVARHHRHKCVNEAVTSLEECIDPSKFNHSMVRTTLFGSRCFPSDLMRPPPHPFANSIALWCVHCDRTAPAQR